MKVSPIRYRSALRLCIRIDCSSLRMWRITNKNVRRFTRRIITTIITTNLGSLCWVCSSIRMRRNCLRICGFSKDFADNSDRNTALSSMSEHWYRITNSKVFVIVVADFVFFLTYVHLASSRWSLEVLHIYGGWSLSWRCLWVFRSWRSSRIWWVSRVVDTSYAGVARYLRW